jgi:hypothetical protein
MTLYKHVLAGTTEGDDWSFGLHTLSSLSLAAEQSAWAAAVAALWTGGIASLISDEVVATRSTTISLDQPTGKQLNRTDATIDLPGTSTAGLPYQLSICVSLSTVVATREGRGRFYLPPFTAATIAAARLSTAAQTTVQTSVNAMFAALTGASTTPVIYGRTSFLALQITGGSVGDVFDTQRRRRNKLIESRVPLTIA